MKQSITPKHVDRHGLRPRDDGTGFDEQGMVDFLVSPAILNSMGKQDKNITAMRTNPRDWRIGQIESVAAHAGLQVRKSGGNHVVFQRDGCPLEVCVPARKPIKAVYVVQLLALIDWSPE